jgi:peptide/nickel transport system substrate-binding protein
VDNAGPWGTGPYKLVEGFSTPEKRTDRLVLEANMAYWDPTRFPRLQRIVFDNTMGQKEALELVKSSEGQVDVVSELRPLETLRVAQSAFASVVKNRGMLVMVFGRFNMRKAHSPWHDIRLRQAVNYAINRPDLIQYAVRGNGIITPALVPAQAFGYDPALPPYPFEPTTAQHLLREAGYPAGLSLTLIAPEDLEIQATVVSKMLEQIGLTVDLQVLDADTYGQRTYLPALVQPPEQQTWDIALTAAQDATNFNFPVFGFYQWYVLDGPDDWVMEQPALRQLYDQVLHTVDRPQQEALIRQMERHTREQAYFLFLYNPIGLYAVNKAVQFVPYVSGYLNLSETAVTDQHWSVRK